MRIAYALEKIATSVQLKRGLTDETLTLSLHLKFYFSRRDYPRKIKKGEEVEKKSKKIKSLDRAL
jgi:hypothetical protein